LSGCLILTPPQREKGKKTSRMGKRIRAESHSPTHMMLQKVGKRRKRARAAFKKREGAWMWFACFGEARKR